MRLDAAKAPRRSQPAAAAGAAPDAGSHVSVFRRLGPSAAPPVAHVRRQQLPAGQPDLSGADLSPLRPEDDVAARFAETEDPRPPTPPRRRAERAGEAPPQPPARERARPASTPAHRRPGPERGRTRERARRQSNGSDSGSSGSGRSDGGSRGRQRRRDSGSSSRGSSRGSRDSDGSREDGAARRRRSSSSSASSEGPGAADPAGEAANLLLGALRTADREAHQGTLDRKLRKSFFPSETSEAASIALHGRLCTPATWANLQRFPQLVNASDLGSRQGDVRTLGMVAARLLQHASYKSAVLLCGLHDLVHTLLQRHPEAARDVAVAQKTRDVTNWASYMFEDEQQQLRRLVAHVRTDRLEHLQVPAPNLPANTPPVPVIDTECEKLIRKLSRQGSGGGSGGGGGSGRGRSDAYPGGKRGRSRSNSGGRVFGRGVPARRENQGASQ